MQEWTGLARQQAGVISRAQLRAGGCSDRTVDVMLRTGRLGRRLPGVYLVGGAPWSYEARLWAAVTATDGRLGFATAAHLWGIVDEAPPRVDVVVERPDHRPLPGVRQYRITMPATAFGRHRGLPITTRTATLLDYVGRRSFAEACRLTDRAIQRGWLSVGDLDSRLRGQPGRTGNTMLRRIAAVVGDGAAAQSERELHRILRSAGLLGWRPNHQVWQDGELLGVADVAFVEARVAIEVDGWAYHSDVDRFQGDRTRQNRLILAGWTVLRFTWLDVVERPGYVRATILGQLGAAA